MQGGAFGDELDCNVSVTLYIGCTYSLPVLQATNTNRILNSKLHFQFGTLVFEVNKKTQDLCSRDNLPNLKLTKVQLNKTGFN